MVAMFGRLRAGTKFIAILSQFAAGVYAQWYFFRNWAIFAAILQKLTVFTFCSKNRRTGAAGSDKKLKSQYFVGILLRN
jgi:hypothetical protein